MLKLRKIGLIAAAAITFSASAAFAEGEDEPARLRARLEAANAKLAELENREFHENCGQDIGAARLAISDATTAISAEQFGKAIITLNVLEARLTFIESELDRAVIDDLATKRESDNIQIQTEADDMQLQLETLSQRRQQLQEQLHDVVKAVEDSQERNGTTNGH